MLDHARLREALLRQLEADLALITRAAELSRDEAISEESKAENKYDTRAQEAAYLAEGQARQARELAETIALYRQLPQPTTTGATAELGTLVQLGPDGPSAATTVYFIGPRGGGLEVQVDGHRVLVVTPSSPLGRQLLGRRVGDPVMLPARPKPLHQTIRAIG